MAAAGLDRAGCHWRYPGDRHRPRGQRQPSSNPDELIGAWLTGTSITGQLSRRRLAPSSLAECHVWSSIRVFERTKQGVRSDDGMRGDPGPDRLGADVTACPRESRDQVVLERLVQRPGSLTD